jgi:hypothetical protein
MTDLIKILNNPEEHYPGNFDTPQRANAMLTGLCQDAATEIERLNAEVLEQCRINGMSAEREDALRAELTRLKASIALDKMAENARELGLDYEPAVQEPYKGLSEHLSQASGGMVRIDPVTGNVGIGTPAAQPAVQEPVEVDQATMELAESVGLIGPASRTHDLHAAIQRFHDLICVNATIKAAQMAADAIREATPPAAAVQEGRDWSLLEATQESLREHMAEIKRLKAAQPEQQLMEKAYLAGFLASADGYNGQCPFDQCGQEIESDEDWCIDRDDALRQLLEQQEQEPVQGLPFGVGGGLVAIKTLLGRDPCVHANTAIEMIDAMLAAEPQPVRRKPNEQ